MVAKVGRPKKSDLEVARETRRNLAEASLVEFIQLVHLFADGAIDGRVAGVQPDDVHVFIPGRPANRQHFLQRHAGGIMGFRSGGDQGNYIRADQGARVNTATA